MKPFLSHFKKEDNVIVECKLLKSHIEGVLTNAQKSMQKTSFSRNTEGTLDIIVQLHDLGKYTDFFQNYLKTSPKTHFRKNTEGV